jgi:hypothetical protein
VVAEVICQDTCDFSDQDKLDHRIRTANTLIPLCQKKDILLRRKPDRTWGKQPEMEPSESSLSPKACARTQCIFCVWNPQEPYEVRYHSFTSEYKARDYVELHLKQYKVDDNIPCLDPDCQTPAVILRGHALHESCRACIFL